MSIHNDVVYKFLELNQLSENMLNDLLESFFNCKQDPTKN